MKKILRKIKNVFGGGYKMRIEKMIVFLALFAVLATAVFAATVSHPAENIRAGIFGNTYAGNWSFMNGSVGIGTTTPVDKLQVMGNFSVRNESNVNNVFLLVSNITGRVGIGTASPAQLLDVRKNQSGITAIQVRNDNNTGTSRLLLATGASANVGGGIEVVHDSDTSGDAHLALLLGTGSQERMRIDKDGKVGIGTTNPGAKLHINGTGDLLNISNATESFLYVNSSGRVGIGTTNPGTTLHIDAGAGTEPLRLEGDASTFMSFYEGANRRGFVQYDTALNQISLVAEEAGSSLALRTSDLWRMTIDSDGNVGINTTTPTATLHVNSSSSTGAFLVSNTSGSPLLFVNGTSSVVILSEGTGNDKRILIDPVVDVSSLNPGATTLASVIEGPVNRHLVFDLNSNDESDSIAFRTDSNLDGTVDRVSMVIKSTGNVGIGTTTPNYLLQINSSNNALNVSGVLYVNGSSGNVGIGTNNPGTKLHISAGERGSDVTGMRISTDSGTGIAEDRLFADFRMRTGTPDTQLAGRIGAVVLDPAAFSAGLVFHTTSGGVDGERMRITNLGNVGIGTASPGQKLAVNSTGSTASTEYLLGGFSASDSQGAYIGYYVNSNSVVQEARVRAGANVNLSLGTTNYLQTIYIVDNNGRVGIGTTRPNNNLQVIGTGNFSGNLYAGSCTGTDKLCTDIAETIASSTKLEPGDVVVIDTSNNSHITKSTEAYDTKVAGIVSSSPAIVLKGDQALLGREVFDYKDDVPLALAGRVPVKATTENGAIKLGDLLTTSSIPGHAMKCTDKLKCIGAIVGKALEPLDSGSGKIIALVTLQ